MLNPEKYRNSRNSDKSRTTLIYAHKLEVIEECKFVCHTYPIPKTYQQAVDMEIQ